MKLISVIHMAKGRIDGYLEIEDEYVEFESVKGQPVRIENTFPKTRYEDYESFAQVIGKFDPYTLFFEKPVEISGELTYESILEAYDKQLKSLEES